MVAREQVFGVRSFLLCTRPKGASQPGRKSKTSPALKHLGASAAANCEEHCRPNSIARRYD